MTAISCILALVVVGIVWGVIAEFFEQRRLKGMAENARRQA